MEEEAAWWRRRTRPLHAASVANRPNDREIVIPWRQGYTAPATKAGPVDPSMPSSLRVFF